MSDYKGSPWRSRFLRAPKVGLELGDRDDFVRLSEVATARLGMKTGNDRFFFVTATGALKGGKVRVRGINRWEGEMPLADLLPAVQTPRDLNTPAGRAAIVPTSRGRYSGDVYYFAPRSRLNAITREYIDLGELQGVNRGKLVEGNAGGGDWYRPSRGRVMSPWVLPYNSGYDYGAVENGVGAILNGRCVGVDALEGIDSHLLGAILNSTPVTLMRLLEGVTTGNEGAFDVGPPAVRVMQIPDPRRYAAAGRQAVLQAYEQIRADGVLPPAPDRGGHVSRVRSDLDNAVLAGLGMSGGEAAVLAGRIYASYARWRAAVEDVEAKMQAHRRQLAARGGSRTEAPARRATRTVWNELSSSMPDLFAGLTRDGAYELVDPIVADEDHGQDRLFGQHTYSVATGGSVDLRDHRRVELASRVRTYGYLGPIPIPDDSGTCDAIRDDMVRVDATTTAEIERRATIHVSADLVPEVTASVRQLWISRSIASVRDRLNAAEEGVMNGPDLFSTEGLVPPPPRNT